MSPSAAWLAAAAATNVTPTYVYRITLPDGSKKYFASEGAHFPDGASEPYHHDIIPKGGLPTITRRLQNVFYGRAAITIGQLSVVDDGSWDTLFGDYTSTMRGAPVAGYVTFPGLAWADAVNYLNARIQKPSTNDSSRLTFSLVDSTRELLQSAWLTAGTFTAVTLGSVVKQRLLDGGLSYPADFDTTAWTAWTAAGAPGAYLVTGSWQAGKALDIVDKLIAETLSWWWFDRNGKFFISQFADISGTPSPDIDLTNEDSLNRGGSMDLFEPLFRKQTVLYNAAASSITKAVNLLPSHPWWGTALDGEPKDCGITNLTDATTLASARIALLSSEHSVSTVKTDNRLLAYHVGDIVKLDFSAARLPAITPLYHRIIGLIEDPNQGEVTLTLWSKLGGPPLA